MTAETVSPDPVEMTRKNGARIHAEFLQAIATLTGERAAAVMGVSPSKVSRMKEDLSDYCQLAAALGLKLVPADSIVTTQEELRFYKIGAFKFLQADLEKDGWHS